MDVKNDVSNVHFGGIRCILDARWLLHRNAWIARFSDTEDRRKKITIAIKPVVPAHQDSTDNITDIRNLVQGFRLSPTLQVSGKC